LSCDTLIPMSLQCTTHLAMHRHPHS